MRNIIVFLLFLKSFYSFGQSQYETSPSDSNSAVYFKKQPHSNFMDWQVKSISEFIHRFNYETFIDGTSINDSISAIYSRKEYLYKLFNEDDERLKNMEYLSKMNQFITTICEQDIKIPKQVKIEALLKLETIYLGKNHDLIFKLLKQYPHKEQVARWELSEVILPDFFWNTNNQLLVLDNFEFRDSTYICKGLYPNAQDLAFIPLVQMMNQERSILSICSKNIINKPEVLLLNHLLKQNALVVKATKELSFNLNISNKYQIIIHEYAREKENSGWLIHDFSMY